MIANNKKLQFDLIHYLSSFLLLFFLRTPNNLQHYYNHLFLLQLEARPRPCSLLEFLLNFYYLRTANLFAALLHQLFLFTRRKDTSTSFITWVPSQFLSSTDCETDRGMTTIIFLFYNKKLHFDLVQYSSTFLLTFILWTVKQIKVWLQSSFSSRKKKRIIHLCHFSSTFLLTFCLWTMIEK